MGIILDRSILIEHERGLLDITSFIAGRENEEFAMSVISVAELLHGVHRADSEARRIKRNLFVEQVIDTFPVFPFDLETSRMYAKLWAELLSNGIKIGAHDLMIGATAISKGFSVATFNKRHFDKIKGLRLELLQ
ncbi:MAG: type II toxin-antitoxin system VapC family toxin [Deltaproteobacteria bacterium]|nr:type II toxin-antitoxin system VapC family toxin [Deltaproteobacteria bacterium]